MSAKSRQGGRNHRLKALVTAAVTCLVVVTGCSPSGARIQALNELSSQVDTIRGAASVGDFETALQRLDDLRSRAWEMFRQDELPQADLENILAAAEAVENHLPSSADPPPPEPAQHEHVDEEAEEAKQQAEEEAKKQQEEAQKQAEEAARKQAEQEAKKQEEAQKQAEEAAKKKDQPKEQEKAEGGAEGDDGKDDD